MKLLYGLMTCLLVSLTSMKPAQACSDFMLPFEKGKAPVISGRTMDFTDSFNTMIVKVPQGQSFVSGAPGEDGKGQGLKWDTKYGYVTVSVIHKGLDLKKLGLPVQEMPVSDGLNTEGLSAAALWLSYTTFPKVEAGDCANCMDANLLISYLLGTCRSTGEVVKTLGKIQVWVQPILKDVDRFHLSVHDKDGKSIVVEYVKGKQNIYNNDLAVLTNDPPYDWQSINYNYLYGNLQPKDLPVDKYVEFERQPNGVLQAAHHGWQAEVLGSGMYGMPGDSTPPSRFVRMAALRKSFPTQYDSMTGVQYALQLLGRVAVNEREVIEDTSNESSPSLWWVVRDHSERVLYYAMRLNHELKAVDLKKLDMSKGSGITSFTISDGAPWFTDETSKLQ